MKVLVKLFATFRDHRFSTKEMEFVDGLTVSQVIETLDIPDEEVAICLVNGHSKELDHVLVDGDTLSLFPPVGGG